VSMLVPTCYFAAAGNRRAYRLLRFGLWLLWVFTACFIAFVLVLTKGDPTELLVSNSTAPIELRQIGNSLFVTFVAHASILALSIASYLLLISMTVVRYFKSEG